MRVGYSEKLRTIINNSPRNMGGLLGRWALRHNLSTQQISLATGATKQTVYNWFSGGEVTNSYKTRVRLVLDTLAKTNTHEDAWRILCQQLKMKH